MLNMRVFFYTLLTVIVLVTTTSSWIAESKLRSEAGVAEAAIAPAAGGPGGPFTLTDIHGKKVNSEQFVGKYRLVFFGFTYCPDICPSGLVTIGAALGELGKEKEKLVPIFITIDPQRDTQEQMKLYMESFDDSIVALTGTPAEIKKVADAYKVYYSKVENKESPEDYVMNHSGYIYLMGKYGEYVTHFAHDVTADEMVVKLRSYLKE